MPEAAAVGCSRALSPVPGGPFCLLRTSLSLSLLLLLLLLLGLLPDELLLLLLLLLVVLLPLLELNLRLWRCLCVGAVASRPSGDREDRLSRPAAAAAVAASLRALIAQEPA